MIDPSQYHYPISIARNTLPAYGLPYFPFQVYGYPGGRIYGGERSPLPDQELLDRYRVPHRQKPRIIEVPQKTSAIDWPTVGASLLIAMLLFR